MTNQTPKTIIIATRNSLLAMWQAEYAAKLIEESFPHIKTQLLPMTTKGDQILDVTLNKIGGKGLFLKELEQAMLSGDADIAVHSMKDVPADLPNDFNLCSVFERHDASDAFVSNKFESFSELPQNATVGTSSLRRQSQLMAIRPDLNVIPLRGNVQTRLKKLDAGEYDAIILATAGLERLEYNDRIKQKLNNKICLSAVGQGAVGVECLSNREDLIELLSQLTHQDTLKCITAERTMNRVLNGSCSVAIGAYAEYKTDTGTITMEAVVCAPDGSRVLHQKASDADPEEVGLKTAYALLAAGAQELLDMANN